jgi:hypothetical protein
MMKMAQEWYARLGCHVRACMHVLELLDKHLLLVLSLVVHQEGLAELKGVRFWGVGNQSHQLQGASHSSGVGAKRCL